MTVGPIAITIHERSGWGTVVVCFVVLIAFETIGVHLLVQHWSRIAAWVFTSLDAYTVWWIIGDYRAMKSRPTVVGPDTIELRYGLRLTATIPRDNVAAVEPITNEAQWKRKGTVKLALLDEPKYLIRLREPVVANFVAGIKRKIDAIAILPDDASAFAGAFERALTLH
jgi:hypothetical protein